MDGLDRKILAVLQSEGRLSLTDLAARVGLTVSPAHRRVRDLEQSGAITGYRAVVDPKALGLGFEALVFVTMKQEDRATLRAFEEAVAAVPNVLQAQRLFGDPDYRSASAPPTSTPTRSSRTTSCRPSRASSASTRRWS